MKHSNQARELVLTDRCVELAKVFVGPDGVTLTASSRVAQEAAGRAAVEALKQNIARKQAVLARKRKALQARTAEMQAELAVETKEVGMAIAQEASTASDLLTTSATQADQREQARGAPRVRTNGTYRTPDRLLMTPMPIHDSTEDILQQEIADLRYRLQVATVTLRAIHSGEVDAISTETPAGPKILTLNGMESPTA